MDKSQYKERINMAIDERREEAIKLLSEFIKRPTDNPPSDTRALVAFIANLLKEKGISYQVHEIKEKNQNIVAVLEGVGKGRECRNLVLNGHLDQFPAGDLKTWDFDPYCGDVVDGKILGRGAGDMKGGSASLLFSFLLMKELSIPLGGQLTLMLVADEESGGQYGTEWLLNNREEIRGTAMLNGEDTGAHLIRAGEKGKHWFKVKVRSMAGHGGLGRKKTAITRMAEVVLAFSTEVAGIPGRVPEELHDVMEFSRKMLDDEFGPGTGAIVDHTSVNVGIISGGIKINILPGECEAHVDVRVPLGVTPEQVAERVEGVLRKYSEEYQVELINSFPANYTSPSSEILQILKRNAAAITKKEPHLWFTYTCTDARFFRERNIPVGMVGPAVYNMGGPNEYIYADEYIDVIKIHSNAIVDYLNLIL